MKISEVIESIEKEAFARAVSNTQNGLGYVEALKKYGMDAVNSFENKEKNHTKLDGGKQNGRRI